MNIGNILKVADAIERASIPDLGFNMNIMLRKAERDVTDPRNPSCGTVACIAGWAYTLAHNGKIVAVDYGAEVPAEEWLGLDQGKAHDLFYPEQIAEEIGYDWSHITPQQAATCLRNLAITGEVDWKKALMPNEPQMPSLPSPTKAKQYDRA